jgi:hypothetical protein
VRALDISTVVGLRAKVYASEESAIPYLKMEVPLFLGKLA